MITCRAALGVITHGISVPKIRGNLGALLLEAGRADEALKEFEISLNMVRGCAEQGRDQMIHAPGPLAESPNAAGHHAWGFLLPFDALL